MLRLSGFFFVFLLKNLSLLFASDGHDCPLECYNGGTCVYTEETAGYHCECPSVTDGGVTSTFLGMRCETPATVCEKGVASYSCLNGSTCNLEKGTCNCPTEFSGNFCEDGPTPCMYGGLFCLNGGYCIDKHERKVSECKCDPLVSTGQRCEIPITISEAQSCPLNCYNGGYCVNTEETKGYHCECPAVTDGGVTSTFTGMRCETPATVCKSDDASYTCLNGSSCNLEKGTCDCLKEFSGDYCEHGPNACMYGGLVCLNGGTCNDRHEKQVSRCNCNRFVAEGEQCEILVTGVRSKPGAIAGIVAGSVVGFGILVIVLRRVYRRCTGGDIEMQS